MSQTMTQRPGVPRALKLEYPMPVATYDSYEDAQKAVDFLTDQQFPVENLAIVGTDLRQYERVLGRKSWGSVLLGGAISGIFTGLTIALMLLLLGLTSSFMSALLMGLAFGMIGGALAAALGHALSRGERDFNSITQTFATSYEVMAEHKVAQQARDLLARVPGIASTTAPPVGVAGHGTGAGYVEPASTGAAEATSSAAAPAASGYGSQAGDPYVAGDPYTTGATAADPAAQPTFDPRPPADRA